MAGMGALKPWHLLVLLFLLAGPLFGYVKRDKIERKGWLSMLGVGVALFFIAAVAHMPVLNIAAYFGVGAGLVGAITTRQ